MTTAPLRGEHVVVTGATGFIGSAVARYAVIVGANVHAVARPGANLWRLHPVRAQVKTIESDLGGLASAAWGGPPPAAVVHCAAAGVNQTFDDVETMTVVNVNGTLAALRFAERIGARRFVLAGTSGEYGPGVLLTEGHALNPTSEYGATRAGATLLAQAFGARRGLDVVIVRPFAVYGPFEAAYRLIPYAITRGLRGEPIRISSGVQTRDYVHVDDVAEGIALACASDAVRGRVINLCTGVETSVLDAATLIARETGGASKVEAGVREPIPGEMWRTTGGPSLARELMGWTARQDLVTGVRETIAWFRAGGLALPEYSPVRG